jgi:hypothetical protein
MPTEGREIMNSLRRSEEINRRVLESSQDCINVLDIDGNLLSMSKGGQRQLEIQDITRYLNQRTRTENRPSYRLRTGSFRPAPFSTRKKNLRVLGIVAS